MTQESADAAEIAGWVMRNGPARSVTDCSASCSRSSSARRVGSATARKTSTLGAAVTGADSNKRSLMCQATRPTPVRLTSRCGSGPGYTTESFDLGDSYTSVTQGPSHGQESEPGRFSRISTRRDGRVVDGGGLKTTEPETVPGFESLSLRQIGRQSGNPRLLRVGGVSALRSEESARSQCFTTSALVNSTTSETVVPRTIAMRDPSGDIAK